MERLHQELAALPGLETLSASQLHDLPWRTKEQVLIALFREQTSSAEVARQLQSKSRDRRMERKADKLLDDVDRAAVWKKEERYRADFMQVAATELARLGAPALLSWQKLVFDNECCAQAFRLLLTRIKSTRRSTASGVTTNSSSLLAARYAAGSRQNGGQRYEGDNNAQDDDDDLRGTGGFSSDKHSQHEPEQRTRFPPLKTAHGPLSRVSDVRKKISAVSRSAAASPSSGLDWNFDTTVDTPSELDDSDGVGTSLSTPSRDQTKRSSNHLMGAGISIERTFPTKLPSYFATKFRKNQVHALQEENAGLTKENAKLREEIKQLEALNAVLQDDNNNSTLLDDHSESIQFAQRRMRLLQAQNVQLQRQISLLQDALQAQANAETNLMSALNHWRGVIDAGKEEAKQAGADQKAADKQNAASSNNQPIKWMLAIPDKLIEELNRVEGQIHSAANAAHSCYETKLRVSHLSASFLRDDATSLKLSEIYGRQPSSLAHLRIERVKQLEDALARVAGELEKVSSRILEQYPPHASITDPNHVVAYELGKSVRELLLEVSAFGAVVFTPTATVPGLRGTVAEQTEDGHLTALDVVKALSSTSGVAKGPGGVKEREKQAKVMLKQLHARFAGMESHAAMCRREAKYWRTAWQTQDDSLQRLAKRVRGLGQKKVEWCQHYLLAPMTNLAEVFASFQQCYDENSTRQNPYLPLLVETLSMEHPMVQHAIQQWQAYVESVQLKMNELVADYEANRLVLASSLAPPSSLSSPPAQYGHETLPSESEQVPLH